MRPHLAELPFDDRHRLLRQRRRYRRRRYGIQAVSWGIGLLGLTGLAFAQLILFLGGR